MKNAVFSFLLLNMMMPLLSHAKTAPVTKQVNVTVSSAYVPGGFSSTTDAYVIVSGMFSNSCYQWDRADVNNLNAFTHEIRVIADVTQNMMCAMHLVPYQKEVDLGVLQSGAHTLRFIGGDGTYFEQGLTIE